jgi:hypothetical protein
MRCGTSSGRFSNSLAMSDHYRENKNPRREAGVSLGAGWMEFCCLSEEGEQDLRSRVCDRNGLDTQLLLDL